MDHIYAKLIELGIPAHLCGFDYLHDAIKTVIDDENAARSVVKEVYMAVAENRNKNWQAVERAMRVAIENASGSDSQLFKKLFFCQISSRTYAPRVSGFIKIVALECKEEQN